METPTVAELAWPYPGERHARQGSPEHRAAMVAAIHALGDLIETNLSIPVPDSVGAQYSILTDLTESSVDFVRSAAAVLGVEPQIDGLRLATATFMVAESHYSQPQLRVSYVVHGSTVRPAEPETGLGYSRADDGETTQAVGRVEMHTGGVVSGIADDGSRVGDPHVTGEQL